MTNAFSCKTLLAFDLLHFVLQGQICPLLQVSLTSYFCIPVPYNEKDIFFGVLVLEDLVGLHRNVQFQLLSITGQNIDLDYCDTECFALEMNRDRSVSFEIASKYFISHSFVDYDGYPVSSRGFLPTIADSRYNGYLS